MATGVSISDTKTNMSEGAKPPSKVQRTDTENDDTDADIFHDTEAAAITTGVKRGHSHLSSTDHESDTQGSVNPGTDQLSTMINNAVTAAVTAATKQLYADFADMLYDVCDPLKEKIRSLEEDNSMLKKGLDKANKDIVDLKGDVLKLIRGENDLEQYSRKSCVRVFGIDERHEEVCAELVKDVIHSKLELSKFPVDAIDVAHRVGPKQTGPNARPRAIIVRLSNFTAREKILRSRKKLKGSNIIIREDLTHANQRLLMSLKHHDRVQDAWSWNGKIFAKGHNGHTIQARIHDDIDRLLNMGNV